MIKLTNLLNESKLTSGDFVTVVSGKYKGKTGMVDRTSINGKSVLVKLTDGGIQGFTSDELTTKKVKESVSDIPDVKFTLGRDYVHLKYEGTNSIRWYRWEGDSKGILMHPKQFEGSGAYKDILTWLKTGEADHFKSKYSA